MMADPARCAWCGELMDPGLARRGFPEHPDCAGVPRPGLSPLRPQRPAGVPVMVSEIPPAGPCHGCGRADTRLYASGPWCPEHTPARREGRPEPDAARYCAPGRCYCGACPSYARPLEPITSTIVDYRVIAKGSRRAGMTEYRDAQRQTGARS